MFFRSSHSGAGPIRGQRRPSVPSFGWPPQPYHNVRRCHILSHIGFRLFSSTFFFVFPLHLSQNHHRNAFLFCPVLKTRSRDGLSYAKSYYTWNFLSERPIAGVVCGKVEVYWRKGVVALRFQVFSSRFF